MLKLDFLESHVRPEARLAASRIGGFSTGEINWRNQITRFKNWLGRSMSEIARMFVAFRGGIYAKHETTKSSRSTSRRSFRIPDRNSFPVCSQEAEGGLHEKHSAISRYASR